MIQHQVQHSQKHDQRKHDQRKHDPRKHDQRKPTSGKYIPRRYAAYTAALLLTASACGSKGAALEEQEIASIDSTSSTSAPSSGAESEEKDEPVDPEEVFARYEACMAEHGVVVSIVGPGRSPIPGSNEPGTEPEVISPEAQEEADAECGPILDEAFGSFEPSPEQEAERSDEMLALQLCLSDAGFEVELNGGSFEIPDTVDFAEFQAALSSCDAQTRSPASDS